MTQITPEQQGRVFAANAVVQQIVSAGATLMAGPLADRWFEPAMQSSGHWADLLSPILGRGAGSGMALLYVLTSIGLLLVGVVGYSSPHLRRFEAVGSKLRSEP